MQSLIDTLKQFDTALLRGSGAALCKRMSYYNDKMVEHNRDFYTTTINSNNQIRKTVQAILTDMGIPSSQWGRYLGTSLTVYDFLVELREHNKKENEKLKEFIALIDEQVQLKWKKIILAGLITLGITGFSWPFLASLGIQELLAAALFVPVVGVVFTSAVVLYSLYKNLFDKNIPLFKRFQDNFFLLANAALKFAAYGVLIMAATTETPVVAILFIVAEVLSVLKEIVSLVHILMQERKRPAITGNDNLSIQQHQARYDFDYLRRRNSIWINMAAAVISVGIVAAWCFIPGGIFISIAALAIIGIVFLATTLAHRYNESIISERLKNKFVKIESDYEAQQRLTYSPSAHPDRAKESGHGIELKKFPGRPSQCGMFSGSASAAGLGSYSAEPARGCSIG